MGDADKKIDINSIGVKIRDTVFDYEDRYLTNADAKKLLELNSKNRRINIKRVLEYAEVMSKGKWELNGQSILISSDNIIIDGQHRLMAIARQNDGVSIQTMIGFGLKPTAFDTIDMGKKRSASDLLTIRGIGSIQATIMASAAKLLHVYHERIRIKIEKEKNKINDCLSKTEKNHIEVFQNKDIYDFIKKPEYENLFLEGVFEVNKYKDSLPLSPSEALFIYILLVGLDENKGKDFCKQIFSKVGIVEGSPIHVLSSKLNPGATKTAYIKKQERIASTIIAWNYFIQDRVMPTYIISKPKLKENLYVTAKKP